MPLSGEHEPAGGARGEPAWAGRAVREILTSMLIVAVATAFGGAAGLGGALLALETSEGDARGGEMLVLGFSVMGGCAIGFVAGVVRAVRHARRRWPTRRVP